MGMSRPVKALPNITHAIAYRRVSTTEQGTSGLGMAGQLAAIGNAGGAFLAAFGGARIIEHKSPGVPRDSTSRTALPPTCRSRPPATVPGRIAASRSSDGAPMPGTARCAAVKS